MSSAKLADLLSVHPLLLTLAESLPDLRGMQLKCVPFLILVAIFCVSARPVEVALGDPIFQDCGSDKLALTINSVTVNPPCTAPPCILPKGKNASIVINITSAGDFKDLKNKVTGKIAGIPIPFPLPQADGCKDGIQCPVVSGQSYRETVVVPVLKEYPTIKVPVKWELKDENGNVQGCFEMEVEIK